MKKSGNNTPAALPEEIKAHLKRIPSEEREKLLKSLLDPTNSLELVLKDNVVYRVDWYFPPLYFSNIIQIYSFFLWFFEFGLARTFRKYQYCFSLLVKTVTKWFLPHRKSCHHCNKNNHLYPKIKSIHEKKHLGRPKPLSD